MVSFEALASQNVKLRRLPKNVLLSQATLKQDISRSCFALYRGTTAIAQAVAAGLRPIYLMLPGELTIDPLYDLGDWRVKVATISDFQEVMDSSDINNTESDTQLIESKIESAKKYCEDLFLPFDFNLLL
jgi:hypothetical protein